MQSYHVVSNQASKKITIIKLVVLLLTAGLSLFCLFEMFDIMDAETLEYLSVNECSNDDILNKSFVQMNSYYEEMWVRNWVTLGFLCLIIVIDFVVSTINSWKRYSKRRANRKI